MDDYEVLADSIVVGRIFKAHPVPEDRTPTHEADARGPAMAAFAKSWRRGVVLRSGSPLSGANRKNIRSF
jgi:hypothetical protein